MPEYNIDPVFSVYQLAERRQDISRVISQRRTMSIVSYLIEDTARIDHVDNILFSSFQYLSRFLPQVERYREVAQYARHVYVFGVPDAVPPTIPNVTYVPVERDFALTKEWFIVSHGPHLSTALVTQEVSDFFAPDHERFFNGFWIIDDEIVAILYDWLLRSVNSPAQTDIATDHLGQRHQDILQKTASRFAAILTRSDTHDLPREELHRFLLSTLKPVAPDA